jgi:hypothetical protein
VPLHLESLAPGTDLQQGCQPKPQDARQEDYAKDQKRYWKHIHSTPSFDLRKISTQTGSRKIPVYTIEPPDATTRTPDIG